jgi:hypothetical protein
VSYEISAGFFLPNVLIPLIHLSLVSRHGSLVHAAAVTYRGHGVLIAAWGGTGKTSTLITLLRHHDCRFMADDIAAVTSDGNVHRMARTINVLDYNLRRYPDLARHFPTSARAAAAARSLLARVRETARRRLGGDSLIASVAARLAADAKALANAKIPAECVVEERAPRSAKSGAAAIDLLVLLDRGHVPKIEAFNPSLDAASHALAAALDHEFTRLIDAYRAYRGLVGTEEDPGFESLRWNTAARLRESLSRARILGLRLPMQLDDYNSVAACVVRSASGM